MASTLAKPHDSAVPDKVAGTATSAIFRAARWSCTAILAPHHRGPQSQGVHNQPRATKLLDAHRTELRGLLNVAKNWLPHVNADTSLSGIKRD